MTSDPNLGAFAEAVSSLLDRSGSLESLRAGAQASAEKYSIENMATNFRNRITSCLEPSLSGTKAVERVPRKNQSVDNTSKNSMTFASTTSWDDGHPLDLRIAELLAKHGLRGTFYVPLENSRTTLSPTQIRELSSAFEIGAHTVHHFVLTTLPRETARAEIVQSKEMLEEITGKTCMLFCFPKGRYANVHVEMLSEAGFTGARTVELLSFDGPRTKHGIAIMPTTLQACPNSTLAYMRNAAKRLRPKALWNLFIHNRGTNWESMAISLLHHAQDAGGIFHLWGHSWEIEEYQQWKALDRVLAAMADAGRSASCVTNSELCINGR